MPKKIKDYREQEDVFYHAQARGDNTPGNRLGDLPSVMFRAPKHGDTWGPFKFNTKNFTLEFHRSSNHRDYNPYYIDLERCIDSSHMLDALFQMGNKVWLSTVNRGQLLEAVQDIMEPQAWLCSGGRDKTFDIRKYYRNKAKKKP